MTAKRVAKICCLFSVLLGICADLSAQATIESPVGGWRASIDSGADFLQEVTYPASSVNSAGKSAPALIRGHIQRVRKPAKLVANGVAMPLLLDEGGSFNRPYAFGTGSNSVQVRAAGTDANRRAEKSVQFYDAGKGQGATKVLAGLRVVLSWSSENTDLDLHVITPAGGHAFYGNRVLPDGSALDVDVTTGYGPEIWAAPAPAKGVYHVYVNYFGAGEIQDALTIAEVAIVTQEGSLHEKRQVFRVPLRKPGELMLVKSFVY